MFSKVFFLHLWCHSEDVLGIWGANTEAQAHTEPLLFPTTDTEFLLFPMPWETLVAIPLLDTFYLLPVCLPCFACLVPGTKPRALDRRGKRSTTELRTWLASPFLCLPLCENWRCYLDTRHFFRVKLEIPFTAKLIQFRTTKVRR